MYLHFQIMLIIVKPPLNIRLTSAMLYILNSSLNSSTKTKSTKVPPKITEQLEKSFPGSELNQERQQCIFPHPRDSFHPSHSCSHFFSIPLAFRVCSARRRVSWSRPCWSRAQDRPCTVQQVYSAPESVQQKNKQKQRSVKQQLLILRLVKALRRVLLPPVSPACSVPQFELKFPTCLFPGPFLPCIAPRGYSGPSRSKSTRRRR